MAEISRNEPVLWNGAKLGMAQTSKYNHDGAVSQEDTDDGIVLAFGTEKTTLQVELMSPVGGFKVKIRPQEQGRLQVLCEGELHTIDDAVMTSKGRDSGAADGKTKATWNFVGGKPKIT